MDKISEKGIETNERFWRFIKLFITTKGITKSNDVTLIQKEKAVTDNLIDI